MSSVLHNDRELDSMARVLNALANEAKHTRVMGAFGGEANPWLDVAEIDLHRAGMWMGRLRKVRGVDGVAGYPYPASLRLEDADRIEKPAHNPSERPIFKEDMVEFLGGATYSYPGITLWTPVQRIKAMRDIVERSIVLIKIDISRRDAELSGFPSYARLTQYAWEGVMLLEHSKNSLGMVLGCVYQERNQAE